jgi:hypothetical protein
MELAMQISPDQRRDTESLLRAVLTEAHRQADLVAAFLVKIGFCPPPDRRGPGDTCALPQDMLLKLGALVRIYQWERAEMLPHLRADLPSSGQLLDDIEAQTQGDPPRFSGEQVNREVLKAFLEQIAWSRVEGTSADLAMVQSVATEQLLDQVARLLWRHRHLGKEGNPLSLE